MSTTLSVIDAILIGLLEAFTQYRQREQKQKKKKKKKKQWQDFQEMKQCFFFLSFGRENALGQQHSTTTVPSLNNHSKIFEVAENNFVLRYIKTQAWVRTERMAIITEGADACRKLCNSRKFLHWSLQYSWTKRSPVIDDITCSELLVTHYLREMCTKNA